MTSHEDLRQIQQLAYRLWNEEGCPEGRALANWIRAERMLSDETFLQKELEVEVEEGGILPRTQVLPPAPDAAA